MFIQNTSPPITENLQLHNKVLSCLKIDKVINYPPKLFPKMSSLILVDEIENALLKDICSNRELRDFLCINIQEIGDNLCKRYTKFVSSKDTKESIFAFKNFGFLNDDSIKSKDEEYYNYLKDLTIDFASKIDFLGKKKILDLNNSKVRGFEDNLLNPFLHLLKSINITPRVANKACFELETKSPHIQNLIMAWQNKTIFERIIAKLIEDKLKCKVYCSKYIVINQNNPLEYSLEFDNIFVWNNKICFIELKNGSIGRNEVFQFLGKVRAVEDYYGFKVDKIAIIGTRPKETIFDELEEKISSFKVFDIEDYQEDFEKFFEFIQA